jgi:PAS domain S-box-containing protein
MASDNILIKQEESLVNIWLFIIINTTVLALLINILSLHFGSSDVAPYLLFIPVVIASYWYPSKGPVFAIVIAALYLGIFYIFASGATSGLLAESVKCYVLIGVGVVVSSLATHMRQNEVKYRGIFDNSEAGVGLINFSGFTIADVNDRFASTLGYLRDELLSMGFSDLWADQVKKEEFFQMVSRGRGVDNIEARFLAKDKTYRWVLVSAGTLPFNQFVCTIIDISDRKKADELLLIKDHAISSSINAIAILDLAYNTTYINESLIRIMEYNHEKDLLGKNISLFINSVADYNEIRESIQKNGSWFGETVLTKADRTPFYGLLWANLVRDERCNPLCIMTSFIDVSENKEMEIVKRKALEQIEKNIEQFAILGDHIRNPLAVIIGLSSLAPGEITDKIITQAKEIDRIVTQLDRGWIESEKVRDFIKRYYKVGLQEIAGREAAAKKGADRTKYFPEKSA